MKKHVAKARASTVPASLAEMLIRELVNIGVAVGPVLAGAGLPFGQKDLLSGRVESLSAPQFALFFRDCVLLMEEHAARLGGHPPMSKKEFQLLCYCVISGQNLAEAIARTADFCRMLDGRAGELSLRVDGNDAVFEMKTYRGSGGISALLVDLFGLVAYHRFFGWLIGESIFLDDIGVVHPELRSRETIVALFNYPVRFNCSANNFRFSAKLLERPVLRSPRELDGLLDLELFPFDLMSSRLDLQSLSDGIRHVITAQLVKQGRVPTIAQLASLFNTSSATLRRRLDEEGSSVSEIKEHSRRSLAEEYLKQSHSTIEEIAYQLGFSEARAFRRAFVQWTGMSPQQFRAASGSTPG